MPNSKDLSRKPTEHRAADPGDQTFGCGRKRGKKLFVRTNYGFDMFLQQTNSKQSGWRFFQDKYAPKSQTFLSCPKSHQETIKAQLLSC